MKEDLLQFIWKFKYFNLHDLRGYHGEKIEIIHQGLQNFNQGPDFLNAKVRINDTLWVGNIEIHFFSRQWEQHKHHLDKNYSNVILHVVWHHDGDVQDINGNTLPTLELESRVSKTLLKKYQSLLEKEQGGMLYFVPCESHLMQTELDEFRFTAWKNRLVAERLEAKTKRVFEVLKRTEYHWDETMWQLIAANFGGTINGQIFQRVAQSVPQKTLAKHKEQLIAIESILFGQAGLLEQVFTDPYPSLLQREYRFYQKKYGFERVEGSVLFGRMRPANFPTIRLAQLAALIQKSSHLFSKIKEFDSLADARNALEAAPNDFWLYHYKLDDPPSESGVRKKTLGDQMIENIIINTFCPILFAYGMHHDDQLQKEKAIAWLEGLSPEKNQITRGFERLRLKNENAFDSQALIQLKAAYCDKKKCLECAVGNIILSSV